MTREEEAIDAIIADLRGRSGLDNAWDSIDKDIRAEIRSKWLDLVTFEDDPLAAEATSFRVGLAAAAMIDAFNWYMSGRAPSSLDALAELCRRRDELSKLIGVEPKSAIAESPAVLAEREACAVIVETIKQRERKEYDDDVEDLFRADAARAIRARSA